MSAATLLDPNFVAKGCPTQGKTPGKLTSGRKEVTYDVICRVGTLSDFCWFVDKNVYTFCWPTKNFLSKKKLTIFDAGIQAYGREIRGFVTCCGNSA